MTRVITYGTYDLFHQGHYNLLKHAKALGDYLIVGVTSDTFDKGRGKLNVHDSLMTRIENVRKTGLADQIIVEEYFGQKIDDIHRYDVDIFTVGSDWKGHFDYLQEFCKVVYLPRTKGISSTEIRNRHMLRMGILGAEGIALRFAEEARFVSGLELAGIYETDARKDQEHYIAGMLQVREYEGLDALLQDVDAVYVAAPAIHHAAYIRQALEQKKHVLVEYPAFFTVREAEELYALAKEKQVLLFHGLKTAYCPAFQRLVSMAKSGMIGNILSVDANFTRVLGNQLQERCREASGGSMMALGEYPLLAFFKLLGLDFRKIAFFSRTNAEKKDIYTRFFVQYGNAIGSAGIGLDAKSEGNLVVTGTRGYIYVPAPWWKTEYFEVRYEDLNQNRKYFYKFQGEGLRYEIAEFLHCIRSHKPSAMLTAEESVQMARVLEQYRRQDNVESI